MGKRYLVVALAVLASGCAVNVTSQKFGVEDVMSASAIDRVNRITQLRRSGRFDLLAVELQKDANGLFKNNSFARQRVLSELAEVYSFNLLDVEAAVKIDQSLLAESMSDRDELPKLIPENLVASQRIVADPAYISRHLRVKSSDLRVAASARLERNNRLLSGNAGESTSRYSADVLDRQLGLISDDLGSVREGSAEWYSLISRYYKADYERSKVIKSGLLQLDQRFMAHPVPLSKVDLEEIDFLSLADFYAKAFQQTRDVRYARSAFGAVYKPYLNLRDSAVRWTYNKLVNRYLDRLIESSVSSGNYSEALYYISLNKSRMIMEERLAFSTGSNRSQSLADVSKLEGIELNAEGLPDPVWFQRKTQELGSFIDFYVAGDYRARSASNLTSSTAIADRSAMPLTTRDFGVETSDDQVDAFEDTALYVTIKDSESRIQIRRIDGAVLRDLRAGLNSSYAAISQNRSAAPNDLLKRFAEAIPGGAPLKVFPDKWLSRHSFDLHFDRPTVRSVNVFMSGVGGGLDRLSVTGFFNPTLDLGGAEAEAAEIVRSLPNAQTFLRDRATVGAVRSTGTANVVHLSMHGAFNPDAPRLSKLYFSGARRGLDSDDPNAIYAKDMLQFEGLTNKDLIFAAACQTGLSSNDTSNVSEMLGIVRPLVAGKNRNLILSLWKVSDAATKDFVASFYENLARTRNVNTAFVAAQRFIRERYKSPYYWAAFYLSQNI